MSRIQETSNSNEYFDSYDNISVHNIMLRDRARVSKYREAIMASKNLLKDKVVLDVGCGTGILSLFCVQAGAKHVYGVEASKGIYELAKSIVKANRMEDKITLINKEIEKIHDHELPVEKVDAIVSEWMGFYLLHESMLASVLYARDRWLRADDGLMLPAVAYLYMCPVDMSDYLNETLSYWCPFVDGNGLDYSPMAKVYAQMLLDKPLIETVQPKQLIDDEHKIIASFDLKECTLDDLKSIQSYDISFTANRNQARLNAFAFWFDVVFKCDQDECIYLSTSPSSEATHWKQTIAFLPEAICDYLSASRGDNTSKIVLNEGDLFECYVVMNQSEQNERFYEIDIGVDLKNASQNDDDDDNEDDEEEDDEGLHPVPCDCGKMRCILIKATLEKYESQK